METCFALLNLCAGKSPVTGEFSSQIPATRSFDFFIWAWINGSVNNREAGDLKRRRAHYDATVMKTYRISHDKCKRLCCALLCFLYESIWYIHPLSSVKPNANRGRPMKLVSDIQLRLNRHKIPVLLAMLLYETGHAVEICLWGKQGYVQLTANLMLVWPWRCVVWYGTASISYLVSNV